MTKFYMVQQYSGGGRWITVGHFKTKKAAKEYCKQFNTKVEIGKLRI